MSAWGMTPFPMSDYSWFQVVIAGRASLDVDESDPVWLQSGVALVPHGAGRRLRSEPGVPAPGVLELDIERVSERYEILRLGEAIYVRASNPLHASRLGYRSKAACARAFKRVVGVAPGAVKRPPGLHAVGEAHGRAFRARSTACARRRVQAFAQPTCRGDSAASAARRARACSR
jgi:hypothetical protein